MASYDLLQQSRVCFESPAKVFAKLKSKVQQEAMLANGGVFNTRNDVRERHGGAGFPSPRKKTVKNEFEENQEFDSYHNDALALTLSPVWSPPKPRGPPRNPLEETCLTDARRGGAALESTAVAQLLPVVVHGDQSNIVSSRTPVKTQPSENCGRSVLEKKDSAFTWAGVYSPIRSRLRKRKLDQQESNTFIRATEDRRNPACTQDYTHNTSMQGVGHGGGVPAELSGMTQDDTTLPQPMLFCKQDCSVVLDHITTMSPAKMFASMKQRENMRFNGGSLHESRDTPVSTAHSLAETEDTTLKTTPDTTGVVNREDSADGSSDANDSEDTLIPAAPSQPILLEDPLVLKSPQIFIPKKDKIEFKRNHWPQQKNFPVDSVIYLKKWLLRKCPKGLFVEGIHGEKNMPWNSNVIVERVSNTVVKTVSGRVYILVGKMKINLTSEFPKSFLKRFISGFPPNWNTLYEKFLSESKQADTQNSNKVKPEASSINQSRKRRTPKPSNTRKCKTN